MTNDVVARLREEGFITHMAKLPRESKILHAAADEIEQLRNELDGSQLAYKGASYDRDRMRAERDEARRWLRDACAEIARIETRFYDAVTPHQIAERNGWDCFEGER